MAIKPDYEAGTVSITNGTNTLSGVNTFWVLAKIQKGDTFKVKNLDAIIEEVVSNTEITLKEPWTGGDLAASAYAIRYQPDGSRFAGAYVEIRDLLANGNLTAFASLVGALDLIPIFTGAGALTLIPKLDLIEGIQTDEKVETLAERAAYNAEAAGFSVLVADIGDGRSAIYFKVSSASGDWSDPAYLTGPNGSFQSKGTYSAATAYVVGDVVLQNGSSWIARVNTTGNPPPTLPTTSNTQWFLLSAAGNGFVFKGAYSGATAYVKDDVVVSQNSSWIALQSTSGNAPPTLPTTNNANWQLIAMGQGMTFRGVYSGATAYAINDTVLQDNSTWIAIAATAGNAPPALPTTSNTWWSLVAAKGFGDVSGPASSDVGNLPKFSTTTGKDIVDSGIPSRTALSRNIFYNPDMAISQENGAAVVTNNGGYAADGWNYVQSGTTGVVNLRQIGNMISPRGSATRVRLTVTTADAAVAAGDVVFMSQNVEGNRLFNLKWGTAWSTGACQAVARIGVRAPAGTYTFTLRSSGAPYKAYNANFTISAGEAMTDIERFFIIPPETAGSTWGYSTALGMIFSVVVMSGSTWQGPNEAWGDGNFTGTAGTSNFLATNGNTFDLFDCGLYADPYATGIAPEWVRPDYAEELERCQRYWQRWSNVVVETNGLSQSLSLPVTMRVAPTASGGGAGFTLIQSTTSVLQFYQTARAYATLSFNARP